jgi:hypothetical protein
VHFHQPDHIAKLFLGQRPVGGRWLCQSRGFLSRV